MIVPFLLFLLSCAGVVFAFLVPGMTDLVMLFGPSLLACLILLWRAARAATYRSKPFSMPTPQQANRQNPQWVVIDGSNVMHWKDGTAQIEPVRAVVSKLKAAGFAPGVVFDANAGYKLGGEYKHDYAFGRLLDLPEDRVMVVNKGNPADPTILAAARDLKARIVSNDRYRDWTESHPEVETPGHVIRGGYRDGNLWLDLAAP